LEGVLKDRKGYESGNAGKEAGANKNNRLR